MAEATSKADAAMASLLEEEEEADAAAGAKAKDKKKAKKKKPKKKKAQEEKAEAPDIEPDEDMPGLEPVLAPPLRQRKCQAPAVKPASEEADAALISALEADGDLDALVAAINAHADDASPGLLKEARAARDTMRKDRKKALKQEKREAERQAQAEALLRLLVNEEGISELQAAITEAEGLAGVSASLDAEVDVEMAQARLV